MKMHDQEIKDQEDRSKKKPLKSLSKAIVKNMMDDGQNLNPYDALLHARRISKMVTLDNSGLLIKSKPS